MNFPAGISLTRVLKFASRTDVFSYALMWLMVLLVIGTVSQKYIGLYQAQEKYFGSWFVWVGGMVPLPGGAFVLTVIFIGLVSKLAIQTWTKEKIGTLIVHLGAVLLLFGGFLTAQFSYEGNMMVAEGQEINFVSDYHESELAVVEVVDGVEKEAVLFPQSALQSGAVLKDASLPFSIKLLTYCYNCEIVRLDESREKGDAHGMALNFDLVDKPRDKQDESNRTGVTFELQGAGEADGRYSLFKFMPIRQSLTVGDRHFFVDIRARRTYLPFSIYLIDFKKDVHPGTMMARSYQAEVNLRDGDLEWHSLIEMNQPLRYKGYTFYQSSFMSGPAGEEEVTVLAVVKNAGRMFPYISSIIICIGLLIHLFMRLPPMFARKEERP
ncbi:MAG: cytochrome c biogenesis protein ResB [Rhodospirillales bacterium]|nr:cytochrome c biogenesis protein ResB [Rhodospirillales bacterium]